MNWLSFYGEDSISIIQVPWHFVVFCFLDDVTYFSSCWIPSTLVSYLSVGTGCLISWLPGLLTHMYRYPSNLVTIVTHFCTLYNYV